LRTTTLSESAKKKKKSGASWPLLEDEYLETSKPEFVTSQKTHGEWIPVKASELKAETQIPMTLYHFMPLNRKFVLFQAAGQTLNAERAQKLLKVGEVYIKREDNLAFNDYVAANPDLTAAGLLSRCRRQYLTMTYAYKDLVLMLSDQSEGASFQKGKALLERCEKLADDFITSLASVGEAWSIVNNASFDDLTPIDRAPAIAATASLMSLLSDIGNPTQVFLASLLADIGLLDLNPKFITSWKAGDLNQLKGDLLESYQRHPTLSVNRILTRKLPLDDKLKNIILCTHERIDMKGFPNRPQAIEKIPPEAQLIQLAEMMDSALKVTLGVERKNPEEARKTVLKREKESMGAFPLSFLNRVDASLASTK